jgi:hypothetical protein
MPDQPLATEADARFPSGKWVGFFTYHGDTRKHGMELLLTFRHGAVDGEGRDAVGEFTIRGRYHLDNGACNFRKQYIARHSVEYSGYNEGKGIWGRWNIGFSAKGGFHIWPEGMNFETLDALAAEEELPDEADVPDKDFVPEEELVPAAA